MKANNLILAVIVTAFISSCEKTEIVEVRAQIVDSMAVANKYFTAKWNNVLGEQEEYAGGTLIQKKLINFAGTNTNTTYKSDGTYTSMYMGASVGGGSWQLVTPRYIVQDKNNATEERYFQIILLDSINLVTKGPFKSTGEIKGNLLYTMHYKK